MKNPEGAFLNKLSDKLGEERFKEKLYERAQGVFRVNPPINPEKFRNVSGYENVEIDHDVKYVRDMEQKFDREDTPEQKEQKRFAKILEAMLNELIELYDWMGPDATTITTSDFDDIGNGVDMVAEFPDKEEKSRLVGDPTERREKSASHLALAVDVTFASEIGKKIERIQREIERGELASVKYFESEFLGEKGRLPTIPRVIIGADVDTIKNLGALWLAEDKKALAVHEIQKVILEEVRMQLEVFAEYARIKNQEKVAETYKATLEVIQDILEDKKDISIDALLHDKVFDAIKREVRHLQREV